MRLLADLYARGAAWRRAWYARHPEARRRLARPVISVGNLAVGGSGKTPTVAALARWLQSQGERPAILTRGYARRQGADGVLVVSDSQRVLEPAIRSGDEPQMLARALPGVPVLAGADRYLAGCIAERRLGATVHLLDDGFQHLRLHRDLDLLLLAPADLDEAVLPAGRLRETIAAAAVADAILAAGTPTDTGPIAGAVASAPVFRLVSAFGAPRLVQPFGHEPAALPAPRAVAAAGIARPERFFDAARTLGWEVVHEIAFPDHHWFDRADLARIADTAARTDAPVVLTTEKDAMRLLDVPLPVPPTWLFLPMTVAVEPAEPFADFLRARLAMVRERRS